MYRRRQLLSIEEAWNLPISAEMSSRQQQQQTNAQQNRTGSQSYQKSYNQGGTPQGPPPPYPSPGAAKRFKTEAGESKPVAPAQQPSFYLSQQQLQLLQYFQQNSSNLTPAQQVTYLFALKKTQSST